MCLDVGVWLGVVYKPVPGMCLHLGMRCMWPCILCRCLNVPVLISVCLPVRVCASNECFVLALASRRSFTPFLIAPFFRHFCVVSCFSWYACCRVWCRNTRYNCLFFVPFYRLLCLVVFFLCYFFVLSRFWTLDRLSWTSARATTTSSTCCGERSTPLWWSVKSLPLCFLADMVCLLLHFVTCTFQLNCQGRGCTLNTAKPYSLYRPRRSYNKTSVTIVLSTVRHNWRPFVRTAREEYYVVLRIDIIDR